MPCCDGEREFVDHASWGMLTCSYLEAEVGLVPGLGALSSINTKHQILLLIDIKLLGCGVGGNLTSSEVRKSCFGRGVIINMGPEVRVGDERLRKGCFGLRGRVTCLGSTESPGLQGCREQCGMRLERTQKPERPDDPWTC